MEKMRCISSAGNFCSCNLRSKVEAGGRLQWVQGWLGSQAVDMVKTVATEARRKIGSLREECNPKTDFFFLNGRHLSLFMHNGKDQSRGRSSRPSTVWGRLEKSGDTQSKHLCSDTLCSEAGHHFLKKKRRLGIKGEPVIEEPRS